MCRQLKDAVGGMKNQQRDVEGYCGNMGETIERLRRMVEDGGEMAPEDAKEEELF